MSPSRAQTSARLLTMFVLLAGAAFVTCLFQAFSYALMRPFSLRSHRRFCAFFSRSFLLCATFLLERWSNVRFVIYGKRIDPSLSPLCLSNHCSDVDWLIGLALLSRLGAPFPGNVKAIVKASLGRVPLFGWILRFAEFLFLTRNWAADRERFFRSLNSLCAYSRDCGSVCLVLFPEGTRLSAASLVYSQTFAREKGYPIFNQVLTPRFKAFTAVVPTLRDTLDGILDLTLMFEGSTPNMSTVLTGNATTICHIHTSYHPMGQVPEGEEKLEEWLLTRWREKDARMAAFKINPASLGPPVAMPGRPSCTPVYMLFVASLIAGATTLYLCSRYKHGIRSLFLFLAFSVVMTALFVATNLRPSSKGSGKGK